ncbi:MAG: hypothetical protein DRI61_07020 [Chloroflexi bacterium]|nr:MAG: hypothetical protein DRI61_07020 [Chloroflexota bacterium]
MVTSQPPTPTPSPQATTPPPPTSTPTPKSSGQGTTFESPLATPTQSKQPTPTPKAPTKAVVTTDNLNIRTGPGLVYPIIDKAKINTEFQIVARNKAGDWIQVCCIKGKKGWASAKYLRIEGGPVSAIKIAANIPPTPTPRPRPRPTPTPTPPPLPYVLTSIKCLGSGTAELKVFVRAGGKPQIGVNVVFVPVGVCNGPTNPPDGSRGCILKVDGPLPGNWQVYLTDEAGNRISDVANIKTDSSGCIRAEIYFDHR